MSGFDLYQDAIKQMAAAAHGQGRLESPGGEAKLDNPLCGDRVRMQVAVVDGCIAALAHETRGCLLCRAAAALVGLRAPGSDAAAIDAIGATLEGMLRAGAPATAGWPELAMFAPARAYPSRHKCVLLPLRALQAALRDAATNSTGDHRGQ